MSDLQMLVTGRIIGVLVDEGSLLDVSVEAVTDDKGSYLPEVRVVGNQSGEVVTVQVREGPA